MRSVARDGTIAGVKRHDLEDVSNVRIAAEGDLFVVTSDALLRMDPATGKTRSITKLKYGGVIALGATHVFAGEDKKVLAIALGKKPKVIAKLSASGEGPMSIAPSPDGRFVLVGGSDEGGTLKCFELGKPRALWTIGGVRYARTAWTPDGKRFVTASQEWSTTIKVHDASAKGSTLVDLGNPHLKKPKDDPGPSVNDVVMEPSGTALLGSDEGIGRIELREGANADWLLRNHEVCALALDGSTAVAGCKDGTVLVFDLAKRAITETLSVGAEVHDLDAKNGHIAVTIENAVLFR